MPAPPAPFIPEAIHGQPTLAIMFVYDGDAESGQAALEPFRQLATPMAELVMPMPYVGIYEMLKDAEQRSPVSHRSLSSRRSTTPRSTRSSSGWRHRARQSR